MLVKGYCPVHEEMKVKEIQELKQLHPLAEVLAHPECNASVLSIADYIGSTTGILKQAAASNAKEFIIATEIGVRYELEKQNPKKTFYFPKTEPVCMDMKKITLDGILHVLAVFCEERNRIILLFNDCQKSVDITLPVAAV